MSNIVKWAAVSDEETFAKVRVEFSFGDGSAVQKTVTMADFIRAMSTIEAEQERCLEIGQIPNGFYDGVLISYCFALKRDASGMIGPASRLCYYPFGNVYDNGKICWGNTVFPKMTSIKDAEKLIQAFFDAETNNDLYQELICKGWFLPSNTYDCGSLVVN